MGVDTWGYDIISSKVEGEGTPNGRRKGGGPLMEEEGGGLLMEEERGGP